MTNTVMSSRGVHKEYHNSDWGAPELDDGHTGHIGLIPVYKQCTTSAPTIATITAGKKGYVTLLHMYNTNAAAQTFTLDDLGTTTIILTLGSKESTTWIMGKEPLFELAAGAVTGDAGTGDYIEVMMSYYEK